MSPIEIEYYRERAAIERENAARAIGAAADVHLELASLYAKLVELEEEEDRPKLTIVSNQASASA